MKLLAKNCKKETLTVILNELQRNIINAIAETKTTAGVSFTTKKKDSIIAEQLAEKLIQQGFEVTVETASHRSNGFWKSFTVCWDKV